LTERGRFQAGDALASEYPQVAPTETQEIVSRMLRVTSGMGLSALAAIALSAVRMKILALQLGPPGLGTLTLLISFLSFASLMVELGVGNSAVREIAGAEGRSDRVERDALRSALYVLVAVLGIFGAAAVALAAHPLATAIFGEDALADEIRLCALAVLATVWGSGALADLNGFRRIRPLALVQPIAALAATAATLAVYLADMDVLPVVIIAPPIAVALTAFLYARALPRIDRRPSTRSLLPYARRLVVVGSAFLVNAGLAALGALVVRLIIESNLGRLATGEFQAAFALTSYYVGFLVASFAVDYMPLLSEIRDTPARLNRVVNTQLAFGILVAAPVIMVVVAAAPVVVALFYSSEFSNSATLLRIMLLGETARVAWWTIGYLLVARSALLFVIAELLYTLVLVGATAALVPSLGLEGTALAYLLAQLVALAGVLALAARSSGFKLLGRNAAYLSAAATATGAVYAGVVVGGWANALSWAVVALWSVDAVRRLSRMAGGGSLTSVVRRLRGRSSAEG
jgi:enterobacterial common antigen flippase